MTDGSLTISKTSISSYALRYHELALQAWLYKNFFVADGYPIPVIFSSPMDAFGLFNNLWASPQNPFAYLFDLKDSNGTPLYEPHPSNIRYPLISVYRRGWSYRTEQNYSIHRWKLNWPTRDETVANRRLLGDVTVAQRPMAWNFRFQLDHYCMRPDTQAFFIDALMWAMHTTGGTPQTWIPVAYPGYGTKLIRMYLDGGNIENQTPAEPQEGKNVEFRTTATLVLEGFLIDINVQVLPVLWTMIIAPNSASPEMIERLYTFDLRNNDNNLDLNARTNVPPSAYVSTAGTYPAISVGMGDDYPENPGFSTDPNSLDNPNNPASPLYLAKYQRTDPTLDFFSGGIPSEEVFGIPTITVS